MGFPFQRFLLCVSSGLLLLSSLFILSGTPIWPSSTHGLPFFDTIPDNETSVSSSSSYDLAHTINAGLDHFAQSPLVGPAISERGARTETIRGWIQALDRQDIEAPFSLRKRLDDAVGDLYPFLKHARRGRLAFSAFRKQSTALPRGIVVATGRWTFRYTLHLISNLRSSLNSTLPIIIAYAGEADLPKEHCQALQSLGQNISCLDLLEYFRNDVVGFGKGENWGYSAKLFAAIASPFRETIVVDGDAVFLQKPEVLLESSSFQTYGSSLFRDRKLEYLWWGSKNQTIWFHDLLRGRNPSPQLLTSEVWHGRGTEEGESAVVALDKSVLQVLFGLLLAAWMNTYSVRESITYDISNGDKETWWLGMELTGAPYKMESSYAGVIGKRKQIKAENGKETSMVCAYTLLHLDEQRQPLWFNGGLLVDKRSGDFRFQSFDSWMGGFDGRWDERGLPIWCMRDGEVRKLKNKEQSILSASLARAKETEELFKDLI